jgi:hypothetical protein
MPKSPVLVRAIISLVACETVMGVSVGLLFLMSQKPLIGPETIRMLVFALGVGIPVALLSFGICTALPVKSGYLMNLAVGGSVGILTSLLSGYALGSIADMWSTTFGHSRAPLSSWIGGVLLALPSAVGGAIVGALRVWLKPNKD